MRRGTTFSHSPRDQRPLLARPGKNERRDRPLLHLKTATIKKHLQNIFKKLGVENRTANALYASKFFPEEEMGPSNVVEHNLNSQ